MHTYIRTYCTSVHSQGDYRLKPGDVCGCRNILPLVATLHAVTLQDRTITEAVMCISPLRRNFDRIPVPVGLLMNEMALGQAFCRSWQYYSTYAPYSFILSFTISFIHSSIDTSSQPCILRPSSVLLRLINLQNH